MKNNSTNGATSRSPAADSPVLTETIKRMRSQTPAESLGLQGGSGLLKPFLQAGVVTLILLALLTVVPYFVDPPKSEAKGPPPIPERTDPAETPKTEAPTKPGPEGSAKTSTPTTKGNKGDILDKLGESGTKTAPLKINPLDKKDDDLLKDIK